MYATIVKLKALLGITFCKKLRKKSEKRFFVYEVDNLHLIRYKLLIRWYNIYYCYTQITAQKRYYNKMKDDATLI